MKDIKIIEIDGIKYVTTDEELQIGDAYVFLDEETNIWGIVEEAKTLNRNSNVIKRKIISMTN